MLYLDPEGRKQLAEEHVARLAADYEGKQSSGSRMFPRLVLLTIGLAFVAVLVVATAQARVTPSFRQTVKPTSRILVRVQATVPARRVNSRMPARRVNSRVPTKRVLVRVPPRRVNSRMPARGVNSRMPARRVLGRSRVALKVAA